jgi:hypothetical protein
MTEIGLGGGDESVVDLGVGAVTVALMDLHEGFSEVAIVSRMSWLGLVGESMVRPDRGSGVGSIEERRRRFWCGCA